MIRVYGVVGSTKNPLKHGLAVLSRIFNDMEFNNPLYYFTLPGFILGTGGVYMGLDFVQTFYLDGTFNFGSTVLMVLLTLIGTFMAFMGILLHSIAGLIRYKMNNP